MFRLKIKKIFHYTLTYIQWFFKCKLSEILIDLPSVAFSTMKIFLKIHVYKKIFILGYHIFDRILFYYIEKLIASKYGNKMTILF